MDNTTKEPAFIEAMTRFTAENGAQMRIWSRMEALTADRMEFARDVLDKFRTNLEPEKQYTSEQLAHAVLQFRDDITAVEVVDSHGNGIVLYSEWP